MWFWTIGVAVWWEGKLDEDISLDDFCWIQICVGFQFIFLFPSFPLFTYVALLCICINWVHFPLPSPLKIMYIYIYINIYMYNFWYVFLFLKAFPVCMLTDEWRCCETHPCPDYINGHIQSSVFTRKYLT